MADLGYWRARRFLPCGPELISGYWRGRGDPWFHPCGPELIPGYWRGRRFHPCGPELISGYWRARGDPDPDPGKYFYFHVRFIVKWNPLSYIDSL